MVRKRPLTLEPLEDRRLLAIIINDDLPQVRVDEGSVARLTSVSFMDSTPGGSYTANISWQAGAATQRGTVSPPSGSVGPVKITFDYRYDTRGFFGPTERAVLETAAEIVAGRFSDSLAAITSLGANQFTAQLLHPETGNEVLINNFSVNANEIVVFVGARPLPGGNLGSGGPGGGSGREPFFSQAVARGQLGAPATDFAPWGGGISFASDLPWNFEISQEGLDSNENDFLSVAAHELFHVLGFSPGVDSFERFLFGGEFTGPAATAAHDDDGAPPLIDAHFAEGLNDDGRETAMDPTITVGQRKLPTPLDFAVLDDVGWQLRTINDGFVSATNVYTDNGSFTGTMSVTGAGESDMRTFQVIVDNVAPTFTAVGDIVVSDGQAVNLSVPFSDPGSADTHTGAIDWGDGTGSDAIVDQAGRLLSGSHTYARPGTYDARIGIQDDDGADEIRSFTITVTEPARGDWQNPANPVDVNNDGTVAPLDALLVINELNEREFSNPSSGLLPPAPATVPVFVDVTGDDIVAPGDALEVINSLGATAPSSRALRTVSIQPGLPSTTVPHPLDLYWAEFGQAAKEEDQLGRRTSFWI